MVLVAVFGDGNTLDQFHRKIRTTVVRGAGIQHAGDVGMIHHRQRLLLRLEAAMTSRLSMPGLMIFRATLRCTGRCCSAM